MATRFRCIFPDIRDQQWTVEIDDADYVGDVITVDAVGGFKSRYSGEGKGMYNYIMGSSLTFSIAVSSTTRAALETFQAYLVTVAEGVLSVNVTRGSSLYWVGYVTTDLCKFDDKEDAFAFEITATDGLAKLKGIEYKDTSGLTERPYGALSFVEHILNCLNESGLSDLYFDPTTDVFLRTVVNWVDATMGAPDATKDPLRYSRVSGEIFAKRKESNNEEYEFFSCYEVLRQICIHWKARVMFSNGCYRFEQIDERRGDTFKERAWSSDMTLVSSANLMQYDRTVNQTQNASRLEGGQYGYLPALYKVKVKYDHKTYKNYADGLLYKWHKNSLSNDPHVVTDVTYDADSYIRVSGNISVDVEIASYTKPWRYVFGIEILTGTYTLNSLSTVVVDSNGNPIPITNQAPATWAVGGDYEISTPFIYGTTFKDTVPFSFWTPVVQSSEDELSIDFYTKGSFKIDNNSQTSTLNDWRYNNLVVSINGVDKPENYEQEREYQVINADDTNSEILEINTIFGHAVKGWTRGKIQTTSNLATWTDAGATWDRGTETNNREFGQLLAVLMMAGQKTPVRTFSVDFFGTSMYAHTRFITSIDSIGWLLLNGEYDAKMSTWSGDFFYGGLDQVGNTVVDAKKKALQPVLSAVPGVVGYPVGTQLPTSHPLVVSGTNNTTGVSSGTITSINVEYAISANAYKAGDQIFLLNPTTGQTYAFEVSTTSNAGDTAIAVNSTSLADDIPAGVQIFYPQTNNFTTNGGGGGTNLPTGTNKYTLRHNGTSWVASSLLQNNASTLGIGIAPASGKLLTVKQTTTADGISVVRSSSTAAANIYHDGSATFESAGGLNLKLLTGSASIILMQPGGGAGQIRQISITPANNITSVEGNASLVGMTGSFAPTTSGGDFSIFNAEMTINQTGTANGVTRGLKIQPTLTAVTNVFRGVEYVPSTQVFLWQPSGTGVISHLIGDLGIGTGTTAPGAKLDIVGDGATSSTSAVIVKDSSGNQHVKVRDDGVAIIRAISGVSGAPSISFGTGAGTGPTNDLCVGSNNGFQLIFTTGTTPTNNASVFTATIAKSFPNGCTAVFSPGTDATRAVIGGFWVSGTGNNSVTISYNNTGALAASTQYSILVVLIGY